jgi:F-type H+-transporting ATPase subunit a
MVHFNWTELVTDHKNVHIATMAVASSAILVLSVAARAALGSGQQAVMPASSFSLKGIFEALIEFVVSLATMVMGPEGKKFAPLFASIFLFIFINNIFGLMPGWTPATENINTTLGLGLFMFITYNYYGFKEHGVSYLKQLMGPVMFLAPFMFVVELISHCVRPLSLGLRLQGNMMGDHILMGVFLELLPFLLPVVLLFLGLFVCFMQAFIFMMLGMIYISMAISHDH